MTSSSLDTAAVLNTTAPASLTIDDMQLEVDAVAWTIVPVTPQTAQVALDAVRYQSNYARTVTSRLCLHYINTIRTRVIKSITSYLFSIDGCELSLVESTGRCDIYYCRPYTYELQLTQKAIGSDTFIVQSIYKTVDQKALDQLQEEISNLDFSTQAAAAGLKSIFYPEEAPDKPEPSKKLKRDSDDDDEVDWSTDVYDQLGPIPTPPLPIPAEPVSMAAVQTEQTTTAGSTTLVAIIGIATVSVSMIAFVVALVMVRWRARANRARFSLTEEWSPLSGIPKRTEDTISISSTESIASDTNPDAERLTGFFI